MSKLRELQNYIEENHISKFVFLSENQTNKLAALKCSVQLDFREMIIYENPDIIFLRDGKNIMRLTNVEDVECIKDKSLLGTIFCITCRGAIFSPEEKYTILAS